jgi:hypothetical protein
MREASVLTINMVWRISTKWKKEGAVSAKLTAPCHILQAHARHFHGGAGGGTITGAHSHNL